MKGEEWYLFLSFLFNSDKIYDFFDIQIKSNQIK
jgi:hypothetical protein